jgi:hypothetical protein
MEVFKRFEDRWSFDLDFEILTFDKNLIIDLTLKLMKWFTTRSQSYTCLNLHSAVGCNH